MGGAEVEGGPYLVARAEDVHELARCGPGPVPVRTVECAAWLGEFRRVLAERAVPAFVRGLTNAVGIRTTC